MSSKKYFYDKYNKIKKINNKDFHNNLSNYIEKIFSKNTRSSSTLFNIQLTQEIFQPSDYCRVLENRREALYRMLYLFIGKNQLYDANACLLHIIRHYYPNICWVWHIGFHILSQIGTKKQMNSFFKVLLKYPIADQTTMVYEYFLYLIRNGEFERVRELYNDQRVNQKIMNHNKIIKESERSYVELLIKMTVAVSCYCIWKKSLKIRNSSPDYDAAAQAELYFRELPSLMENKQPVDNYLLNYIDLLKEDCKYKETFDILKLYKEKCPENINSLRFLLKFVTENREELAGDELSDEVVQEWRLDFVVKMMPISPDGDLFTEKQLKLCVDRMVGEGDYELLADLLFELLENSLWVEKSWPWERLAESVESVGLDNELVLEKWSVRRRRWRETYYLIDSRQKHVEKFFSLFKEDL